MKHAIETNIPFCGLYHSSYDQQIDTEIEHLAEWLAEEHNVTPEAASDALFTCLDCHDTWQEISRLHVATWLELFSDDFGVDLYTGHEFSGLTSPKYYNFSTDRVFARVSFDGVQTLFDRHKVDGFNVFGEILKERFTSYDGFISHYSNQVEAWLEKPLDEWDHNEVCTLLIASIALAEKSPQCVQDFNRNVEYEVMYDGCGNGVFTPDYDQDKLLAELKEGAAA